MTKITKLVEQGIKMTPTKQENLTGKVVSLSMLVNRNDLYVIQDGETSLKVCQFTRKDLKGYERVVSRISKKFIIEIKEVKQCPK
jgi:hypothetical protein